MSKILTCVNIEPLEGNDVAPPLTLGAEYEIHSTCTDSGGNEHYDVGLVSKYSYIRSFATGEELPDGNKIHWCHPSRFIVKE